MDNPEHPGCSSCAIVHLRDVVGNVVDNGAESTGQVLGAALLSAWTQEVMADHPVRHRRLGVPAQGDSVSTSRFNRESAGFSLNASGFVVALAAFALAWATWVRPYPADPTLIPTWGIDDEDQQRIDSPEEFSALVDFIEENAGRKVRINVFFSVYFDDVSLSASVFATSESSIYAPMGCPGVSLDDLDPAFMADETECTHVVRLQLDDVGPERPGMTRDNRGWVLSGYFASTGYAGAGMGLVVYTMTPLTAVEAVA